MINYLAYRLKHMKAQCTHTLIYIYSYVIELDLENISVHVFGFGYQQLHTFTLIFDTGCRLHFVVTVTAGIANGCHDNHRLEEWNVCVLF